MAVVRDGQPIAPQQVDTVAADDDLVFLVAADDQEALADALTSAGRVTVSQASDGRDETSDAD